jgi:hypothetical protein
MAADVSSYFAETDEVSIEKPALIWQLDKASPQVFGHVVERLPSVAALTRRLADGVPAQRTWRFGQWGALHRPDRHVRAMYYQLSSGEGCIAIKGTEVVASNFDQMVERMAGMWNVYTWGLGGLSRELFTDFGLLSALERFPVIEGKPPGMHPVWDAMEEAECALDFQQRHLARYGQLSRVPLPLAVYRWPAQVRDRVWNLVKPHLSPKSLRSVESSIGDGLGTYVYHYPAVPLRVMHLQTPNAGGSFSPERRLEALGATGDARATVEGWLDITARMLALGLVATDPANVNRGYCLQPQNLVIDGGIVDLNSMRDLSTFRVPGEMRFAISRTIQVLSSAVTWYLLGTDAGDTNFGVHVPEVFALVRDGVLRRIRDEANRGLTLHPMVQEVVSERDTASSLMALFGALYGAAEYRPGDRENDTYRGK